MKTPLLSLFLVLICTGLFAQSWTMVDINPNGDSDADHFTKLGNELIFSADDGANGRELWKTDGTPSGTSMIMDINPGAYRIQSGKPVSLQRYGVLFSQ